MAGVVILAIPVVSAFLLCSLFGFIAYVSFRDKQKILGSICTGIAVVIGLVGVCYLCMNMTLFRVSMLYTL